MFSNIGWSEIGVILVVAIIVIGPERLPGLLQDIRAAVFAARKAINNAKKELSGEFEELGTEFEQFRAPLEKVGQLSRMGPRAAIAKTLFDEDDDFFNQFDPRTILKEQGRGKDAASGLSSAKTSQGPKKRTQVQPEHKHRLESSGGDSANKKRAGNQENTIDEQARRPRQSGAGYQSPGGKAEFNWADVI